MTTLTILRGLPGSGKTTRARELVADDPRCARVNRDDLRMMMFGAKVNLTPDQERAVTLAEHAMARALLPNWNVVTDDMNLRPRYVRDWLSIAAQRGADVVMVEMPTPLDECIDRDAQRDAPVSADVIRRIAAKFLPGGRFLPIPDDPEVRIYGMEFELHALTKQMAAECRTETGAPRCYVCHRTDGLRCTAPGWGGVWACDDCRSQ